MYVSFFNIEQGKKDFLMGTPKVFSSFGLLAVFTTLA